MLQTPWVRNLIDEVRLGATVTGLVTDFLAVPAYLKRTLLPLVDEECSWYG